MSGFGLHSWDTETGRKLKNFFHHQHTGTDFLLLHLEDRSRFLRFVTGRSRLPARIYIYPDKLG